MRYLFESKVEEREQGYTIRVPFNVWEVCKKRDTIQGDIVLNNKIIPCELQPIDQGKYEIVIQDETAVYVEEGSVQKVLLHINGSLIRMDENSPYSFANPVRKIDSMDVILQQDDGLCGQSCVAMLAGVNVQEVIEVMGCGEWQASMGHVISALNYYGIDHTDIIVYNEGREVTLPKCCIMMEKMGRFCHYLIHYDGKFYDSNLGVLKDYNMSKLQGYLEIKC